MRALKGAFMNFGAGLLGALPNIVVFQFNPDRVTRTPSAVRPPPRDDGSGKRDSRLQPGSTGRDLQFHSARRCHRSARKQQPPRGRQRDTACPVRARASHGAKKSNRPVRSQRRNKPYQFPPHKLPIVLFFWGPLRIFPVNVTSLSITETEYDPLLNPVRAEVAVNLQMVTQGPAIVRGAYKYSQGVKEVMAALNLARGMAAVGGARF